jgi:hypothetical protein
LIDQPPRAFAIVDATLVHTARGGERRVLQARL